MAKTKVVRENANWRRFWLRISSVNVSKLAITEEILNGKLHFSCSVIQIDASIHQ